MTDAVGPQVECLFCKIAAGDIPAATVGETELSLAFKDINPAAPTHVLVIPREHISSLADLDRGRGALLEDLFGLMRSVAEELPMENGYRVVTNVGSDGGQTVPHLHFHLLGGRSLDWPPG